MRIDRHFNASKNREQSRRRMLTVLRQPASDEVRPCRGCSKACARHGSPKCACGCTFECPYAPTELSSEPDRYPIEPRILPLVFELNALRVVQPCWSCEGHVGPDEKVRKLPSVWFYVDEMDYAVLLNTYLTASYAARRTHVPWIVTLNPGPDDTAFSCRPDLWREPNASLEELQEDALALARDLREQTRRLAHAEIVAADQAS